jgi:L-ascorbate metabolism protein UlaG (beta-lactamase superfamily)
MCMLGPTHRVFFSGDTGATAEHADIGASFGPFDIALFEIGAFHPAWGDIHLGPDGAFEAFARINARALLPVHWSTFDLGLHPWQEPAEQLFARTRREQAALLTPQLGQPLERDSITAPWWRDVVDRRPTRWPETR